MNPEIRVLGERIPLKTTDSDSEFVSEVIGLVSARIEGVEKRLTGNKQPHQVMLLALLDLAEEYIRAKRRTADYKSEIESRSKELAETLSAPCGAHSA